METDYGLAQILDHIKASGMAPDPWLRVREEYITRLSAHGLDLWSPVEFVLPCLLKPAGDDPETYERLTARASELILRLHERGIPRTRTEQYGIRAVAEAVGNSDALLRTLDVGVTLADGGSDPGWFLQLIVPALWQTSDDHAGFTLCLDSIGATAIRISEMGIAPGYPFAVGIAALVRHGEALPRYLDEWLDTLQAMTKSMTQTGINPYPVFEHGLPGLSPEVDFPADRVTEALEVARRLADRQVYPGYLLQESLAVPVADSDSAMDEIFLVARRLAESAIDPRFVVCRGFLAQRTLLPDDENGPGYLRFAALAEDLHRYDHPLQPIFGEGLPQLFWLEDERPGVFARGFALAEVIARSGHNPGRVLIGGLPRALEAVKALPMGETECFSWAQELAQAGIEPSEALANAVPEVAAVAGTDIETFHRLRETLHAHLLTLANLGLDYRRVLVHVGATVPPGDRNESGTFVRILELIDTVVRQSADVSVDAAADFIASLPVVVRASEGTPWILEESLHICTRILGEGGRPGPFLTDTIEPLCRASRNEIERFRELGTVLAVHSPNVPDGAWHAVGAALLATGEAPRDIERSVDRLLHVINRDSEEFTGFEAPGLALSEAITAAAPLATDPDEFDTLVTAVSREVRRFGGHQDRFATWVGYGLSACVTLADGQLDSGLVAIERLGEWCRRPGSPGGRVLYSCATGAAIVAQGDVREFLSVLESCENVVSALPENSVNTRRILSVIISIVLAVEAEASGQWKSVLRLARESVSGDAPENPDDLLDLFRNVDRVLSRWPGSWVVLLAPLLKTQGWYSREYLEHLVWDAPQFFTSLEDLAVLREATVERGVAAIDILSSVLIPLVRGGIVAGLAEERETILAFLREVPFRNPDLYAPYRDAFSDPMITKEERRRIVGTLQDEYREILTAIRAGDVDAEISGNQLFYSAMTYLFPTSMSVPSNSYHGLYSAVPDRPDDVTRRLPVAADRRREYVLTRGGYHLRSGMSVTGDVWEPLLSALSTDEAPSREPGARLGWDLLVLWSEGRIGRPAVKQETWQRLANILRRFGEALPRDTASAMDLLTIRRLFSERLRDAVEEALIAARTQDPERYRRIIQDKLSPSYRVGPGLTTAVRAQLEGYRNGSLSRDQVIPRLSRLLENFAVDVDTILDTQIEGATETELREILESAGPRPVDPTAGIEVTRIHQELTGKEVQAMNRDLYGGGLQPGILEYRPASQEALVTLEVTKRRAHCAVGFVEGVCVATDIALWNNPDFLQVIFWDSDGICRGGVHVLFHDSAEGCNVILPGINPANALLQQVDTQQVLDVVVDFAGKISGTAGCRGLWIPTNLEISSNRQQIREAIEERKWSVRSIPAIRFAHSPYSYVIDEVYELPG